MLAKNPPSNMNKRGRECGETDDAKWTVRDAAMPLQVPRGAAGCRDDVDIGDVRRDHERRRDPAPRAAERRATERRSKQRVRQVIQVSLIYRGQLFGLSMRLSKYASIGGRITSTIIVTNVAITAVGYSPAPTAIPIAALTQIVAAVVIP